MAWMAGTSPAMTTRSVQRRAPARKPLAQPRPVCVSNAVVTPVPPPAPAERFDRLIAALCRAVAGRGLARGLAGPLIVLIWSRLRRLAARFAALSARIAAGRARRIRCRRRPRATARRTARRALPQSRAWLIRLVPEAAASGEQLRYLLAEPEMAALVAAAPQMRRLLRPLCRMLGVRLPPLAPPPVPPATSTVAGAPPRTGPRATAPPAPGRPPPVPPTLRRPHPPPVAA